MREVLWRLQKTADESALFAPQTGLSFHAWLFLGGVYTHVGIGWVFPIEPNTFHSVLPPRHDPRSNHQTSAYA